MSSVLFNNFVRGKLDEDLSGRFDLPVFTNGFPVLQNFISNYKGVLKYRTGFEYIDDVVDAKSKLIEFKFNTDQSYLMVVTPKLIKFYTYDADGNFGYVCEIQNDVIDPDYIKYHTQNSDAMILSTRVYPPYILKRIKADEFLLEEFRVTGLEFLAGTSTNTTDKDALVGPKCAVFHKGRLWFANGLDKTTTIFASKVADYDEFTIPTENIKDDDPLQFTLTDISDPILWLYAGKENLIIGSGDGVSILNGGANGSSVTSTKVNANLGNKEGVSKAIPTEKDGQIIYVGIDKKRAYAFDYDIMSESFVSSNLNLLAEDIPEIEEVHYKRDNNNLVYCRTADGQMIALLYNKAENIIGWYPIKTKGFVNSICTVRRPDGKDDLFISVTRDGQHYIERLSDELEFDNMFDVDSLAQIDSDKTEKLKKEKFLASRYLDSWERVENKLNKTETMNLWLRKCVVVDFYDSVSEVVWHSTNLDENYGHEYYFYVSFADGTSVGGEIDYAPDGSTIYPNKIFPEKYITTKEVYYIVGGFPKGYEYIYCTINGEQKKIYASDFQKRDVMRYDVVESKYIANVYANELVVDSEVLGISDNEVHIDVTAEIKEPIRYIDGYQGLEGVVFSIFANGGYLGQAIVDKNGVIDIGREVSSCIIGYPYLGIAKTFNIGSWIDGVNFQTVKKRAVSFAIRFVNSGSFKVGTSLDNLQQIQEFSTNDEYDSAPQIMNGDRFIHGYNDDHNKEKCLYFVQDEPVPCNVTMVECNVTFNKLD